MSVQTSIINHHSKHRSWTPVHECVICGSKAIGINFGVPTCSPCKAFFRRNARRKEVLEYKCQIINKDQDNNNLNICSQIRRCTSCRLRRCFNVGMKEELIRTDEENQRYKQLIQINRQQRQEILKLQDNFLIISQNNKLLQETDWRLLSNIVYAYENYCLKIFIQNRQNIFNNKMKFFQQSSLSKIDHHIAIRTNNITSFLSFLLSIPIIQSLSNNNRFYLCKHNIRSLIIPNLHEIQQTCFTESWQLNADNTSAEYVYGKSLFNDFIQIKMKAELILITDPVVTRLWLVILFFSTPLICYYDYSLPEILNENRLNINNIQQTFIILLWNYLLHRHGYEDAVRIFSNLIRIYLQMQRVSHAINHQVQTRNDLIFMNQILNQAVVFENDIQYKK